MKVLIVVFLLLVLAAVALALFGVLLADGGGPLGRAKVLTVRLDRPLLDYSPVPDVPFLQLRPALSLATLYRALDAARRDDAIRGVAVYVQTARFGLGKAQELRRLLRAVADAGKFVECYLETAGEGTNGTLAYYLVSACDRISLAPAGDLNLIGLYADSLFLRGTLDKLRIEPQFDSAGRYKSAGETYTGYGHSPAAREALAAVLDDLYEQIVTAVAESRQLSPERVRELVDAAPHGAEEALAAGLVDELLFPDQFEDRLEELLGEEPELVAARTYARHGPRRGRRVAVVFAQGTIVRGDSGMDPWSREVYLGADDLRRVLRQLADDGGVAAVVLRIDSPGGSALASDLMLREVERLQESKPVVVSMSDLAASGGYYIAAKADSIVAEPATLTGSIGVVAGKLVTRRFQEELLGLTHDTLQRGANADFFSPLEPFSPEQAARFEAVLQRIYSRFIDHVASGRAMAVEAVAAAAEGRVWTGERALGLGLVDELGGLDRALELAREAGGLGAGAGYEYFPKPPGLVEFFLGSERPLLPLGLDALERLLTPPPPGVLELPRWARELNRPL